MTMREFDVVGYGEVAIDFIIRTERIASLDDKIWAKSYVRQLGGVTCNFCVGLSRLDRRTAFMGAIGDDQDGKEIRTGLESEGVNTSTLRTMAQGGSPVNYIITAEGGTRLILQSPNMVATQLRPSDITRDTVPGCSVFHTSAIIPETAAKIASLSKEAGAMISFDLERHVAEMGNERIEPLLKLTDILFTASESLRVLGLDESPNSLDKLLERGPKVVILKRGREGVIVITNEEKVAVEAYEVQVVDSTGAGDAFAAGFVSGVLDGASWVEAAALGNAVAAMKCTKMGAQAGLPTRGQVEAFVSARGKPHHRDLAW